MQIGDMGPDDRQGGAFYPTAPMKAHVVKILGVTRTDYIKIHDARGNPGYFFPSLSREELCSAAVEYLP